MKVPGLASVKVPGLASVKLEEYGDSQPASGGLEPSASEKSFLAV